jgi:hypothetical protein
VAPFASAPPDPLLPSPDPQDALIQAVQAGDAAAVARWLQRWVHRRGVASLEPLVARVASLEGPDAAEWLRGQLEQPLAASRSPAPVPPALSVAEPTAEPAAVVESPAGPVASVEPTPEPVAAAGSEEPAEPLPARQDAPAAPAALEFSPLEFELPSFEFPPFELPALEPPAATAQGSPAAEAEAPAAAAPGSAAPPLPKEWSLDLETAFPPLGTAIGNSPSGLETAPVPDPPAADDSARTADPATASPRRSPFARMKSLVRGCLEEARDVLQRFDSAEVDGEAEAEEEILEAEEPERQPARAALPEIPSFLGEGAAVPPSPAEETAAPAPSALSDLRSWLPEAEDQLPRAS